VSTRMTFLAMGLLLFGLRAAKGADDLPDAPGKALVQNVCRACHELDVIAAQRDSRAGWAATVDAMKGRGAVATDQDFAAIVDYLARYLGTDPVKTNVNSATSDEMRSALGLTSDESDAIVQYRKEHGDFKDWDSLTKVKGLDSKKLEPKKDQIVFTSPASETK